MTVRSSFRAANHRYNRGETHDRKRHMTESLATIAAILAGCAVLTVIGVVLWRARNPARRHAAVMAELTRAQTDTAVRLEAMIGMLARGQTQLAHTVNERLDSVSHRMGESLEKTKQS